MSQVVARSGERPVGRLLRRVPELAAVALLVVSIGLSAFWSLPRGDLLFDFGSFVASGQAVAEGLDPYGVYPLTFKVYYACAGMVATPNLNPPISLVAFRALALFDPAVAFRVWYGVALALYLVVVLLLVRAYPRRGSMLRVSWALGLAGLWHTLQLGQIYIPLLLLAVVAWLGLERDRRLLAGVSIGLLVAIKPNFALWPLLLLLAGHWAVALVALACAGLVSLVPLALYGPGIYGRWLAASQGFTGMLLPGNSSLPAIAARLGLPWLGVPLGAALVLGVAALVWRRRPPALLASGLAVVASLLASPITWVGYTLLLLPVLYGRPWTIPLRVAAAIIAFPFALLLQWFELSQWAFVVLGSLYGWALILIVGQLAAEVWRYERPGLRAGADGGSAL